VLSRIDLQHVLPSTATTLAVNEMNYQLSRLKVSDYIIADFVGPDRRPVNFYVAYYASQRKGESTHSPRSCTP
jgi:hypothetical protein